MRHYFQFWVLIATLFVTCKALTVTTVEEDIRKGKDECESRKNAFNSGFKENEKTGEISFQVQNEKGKIVTHTCKPYDCQGGIEI